MDLEVLQEAKRRLEAIPHEMREIYHVAAFSPCVKLTGQKGLAEACGVAAEWLPAKKLIRSTLIPEAKDAAMAQQWETSPKNRVKSPFTGEFGSCCSAFYASTEIGEERARATLKRVLSISQEYLVQFSPFHEALEYPLYELGPHHEESEVFEWPILLHHLGLAERLPFLTPDGAVVVGFDVLGTMDEEGNSLSDAQIVEIIQCDSAILHSPKQWRVVHVKDGSIPPGVFVSALKHNLVDTSIVALKHLLTRAASVEPKGFDKESRTSPPDGRSSKFPTPDGATWSDVKIVFVADDTVRISIGEVSRPFTFAEMGFADGRNKRPNSSWELLHNLAEMKGKITWATSRGRANKGKMTFSRVRQGLQNFIGITEDPFEPYKDGCGYVTKFQITWSDS